MHTLTCAEEVNEDDKEHKNIRREDVEDEDDEDDGQRKDEEDMEAKYRSWELRLDLI